MRSAAKLPCNCQHKYLKINVFVFHQLEQTHDVHLSLEEKFSKGREDSAQLLEQHKLLLEQLDQEAKRKSQLQLELHKAEGESLSASINHLIISSSSDE